jgi:hypothetical protein
VESTQTAPAHAAEGRAEQQLIAGRYRLASLHRRDEHIEVWRALDETSHQVVTLEFLRDGAPAERERFLASGRRMATMEQPTAMKVSAIHDDADAPFIVFEHLVNVPVAPDALKPATRGDVASAAAPAGPDAATTVTVSDSAHDHGLAALKSALEARDLALIDATVLKESALEIAAALRAWFEDLHLEDVRLDTIVAEARSLLERVDLSMVASAFAGARRLLTTAPRARVPAPRVSRPDLPPARVKTIAITPKPPRVPRAPRAARGPGVASRILGRVRWGRVLFRGVSLGVIAAALILIPPELMTNVATDVASQVRTTVEQRLTNPFGTSVPPLARASFELPPLRAYAAAFETQAAYPSAHPNATVEWVVALRNTGSVGWYRGIDGAQASLALSDGTSAGVQSTNFVAPGQVGWFVVHFKAPSEPGTYTVPFVPRIDGRGTLPDLGIYATLTVSPNP